MPRIWTIVGVVLLVVAGLLVGLGVFGPFSTSPESTTVATTVTSEEMVVSAETDAPATSPPAAVEPNPTTNSIAASVNGYTITQSYLSKTVQLNEVLGALSGASVMGEKETLERLIRSRLILQAGDPEDEPTEEEVETLIDGLTQRWGVSDAEVDQELESAGLDRAFLNETIKELLTVQATVESLEAEGHNISEWLAEREQNAEIWVIEDLASAQTEEPTETVEASPTADVKPPTATAAPQPEVPDVAPGFTLDRAGGGTFTLEDQLAEGPVALVFFERCG